MLQALEYVSLFCLLTGGIFCVIGGIGLNRFPDFYTRLHASGVTDTMGAGMFLIGLMLQEVVFRLGPASAGHDPNITAIVLNVGRLLLIWAFLYLSSATSTHALAKSAYNHGPKPWLVGQEEKEKDHNRAH